MKIVLAGDVGVGKTCFLNAYAAADLPEQPATAGLEVHSQLHDLGPPFGTVKVTLWDTIGGERCRPMANIYFRKADGVVFLHDVTHRESLEHIHDWVREAGEGRTNGFVMALVSNKVDMLSSAHREDALLDAAAFAQANGMLHFRCSAKTGEGVRRAMAEIAIVVLDSSFVEQQAHVARPIAAATAPANRCAF